MLRNKRQSLLPLVSPLHGRRMAGDFIIFSPTSLGLVAFARLKVGMDVPFAHSYTGPAAHPSLDEDRIR